MCLSYDTTFEMGDFYVSVLTYRQNEFKETPVILLMFIFHMERIEYVHSFFFSRVAELFPEIAESKRIIIVTDDEKAITNAVFKTWPRISLFRCWIHAWKNIKNQLRKCNIRDKVSVSHYKSDFIKLLLQRSEKSYKSVLARFYLHGWDKVKISSYCKNLNTNEVQSKKVVINIKYSNRF